MGQGGLAALRTGDGVDCAQRVVGAAFIALGFGSTALRCLHGICSSMDLWLVDRIDSKDVTGDQP